MLFLVSRAGFDPAWFGTSHSHFCNFEEDHVHASGGVDVCTAVTDSSFALALYVCSNHSQLATAVSGWYLKSRQCCFHLLPSMSALQLGTIMLVWHADALSQEQLGQGLFSVLSAVAPALQEATAEGAAVPSWCGATEVSKLTSR